MASRAALKRRKEGAVASSSQGLVGTIARWSIRNVEYELESDLDQPAFLFIEVKCC